MSNGLAILGDAISRGVARIDDRMRADALREEERNFAREQVRTAQDFAREQMKAGQSFTREQTESARTWEDSKYNERRMHLHINGLVAKGHLDSKDINNPDAIAKAEAKFVATETPEAVRAFNTMNDLKAKVLQLQASGQFGPEDLKMVNYVMTMTPEEALKPDALEAAQVLVAKGASVQGQKATDDRDRARQSQGNILGIISDGTSAIAEITGQQAEQGRLAAAMADPTSKEFKELRQSIEAELKKSDPKAKPDPTLVEGLANQRAAQIIKTATAAAAVLGRQKESIENTTKMMAGAAAQGHVPDYKRGQMFNAVNGSGAEKVEAAPKKTTEEILNEVVTKMRGGASRPAATAPAPTQKGNSVQEPSPVAEPAAPTNSRPVGFMDRMVFGVEDALGFEPSDRRQAAWKIKELSGIAAGQRPEWSAKTMAEVNRLRKKFNVFDDPQVVEPVMTTQAAGELFADPYGQFSR